MHEGALHLHDNCSTHETPLCITQTRITNPSVTNPLPLSHSLNSNFSFSNHFGCQSTPKIPNRVKFRES